MRTMGKLESGRGLVIPSRGYHEGAFAMGDYNLNPDEFIVMQENNVELYVGDDTETLNEIVLTNQNFILVNEVSTGLFKTERYLKRCPLSKLHFVDDVPQAVVSKIKNFFVLCVPFEGETIVLGFADPTRRTAAKWSNAVKQAAVGNFDGVADEAVGVVAGIAQGLSNSLFGAPKQSQPKNEVKRSSTVAKKCSGCHAPLSGRQGQTVTCSYCDTVQTV